MKKSSAFSLVELSFVILVIGTLVAGITTAIRMTKETKLNGARSLTRNSVVLAIDNLTLWLESTSEGSFSVSEATNGSKVTTWYDINSQGNVKNNATQSTSGYKPLYTANAINGLPALKFDGTDDAIPASDPSISNNFTVFLVASTSVTHQVDTESNSSTGGLSGEKYLIFPNQSGSNGGAGISIGTNGISIYEHGSAYMPPIAVYSSTTVGSNPNIISWVCSSKKHTIYLNGALARSGLTSTKTYVYGPYQIGGGSYGYFTGYLGEFILFSGALTTDERRSVEAYLSKKWSIKVS